MAEARAASASEVGGVAVLYNTNVLGGKLIYLWVILRLISNYLQSWFMGGTLAFQETFHCLSSTALTQLLLLLLPSSLSHVQKVRISGGALSSCCCNWIERTPPVG